MTDTQNSIKAIRSATGLTQEAFSERYGIPRRTIADWERGARNAPDYVVSLLRYRVEHEKEQP